MSEWFSYPNRLLCAALEELRTQVNVCKPSLTDRQHSVILSLVEEIQTHANRMESGLSDWKDIRSYMNRKKELKDELTKLKTEVKDLKKDQGATDEDSVPSGFTLASVFDDVDE